MGKRLLGSLAASADVDVAALLLFLLHIVLLPVCWQRHYNAILCTHTGTHTLTHTHLWQLIFYTFFNSLSIILVCFVFFATLSERHDALAVHVSRTGSPTRLSASRHSARSGASLSSLSPHGADATGPAAAAVAAR